MARCKLTVRSLSEELHLDVDSTVIQLMDMGLPVERATDLIPKSRLASVRAALGLPASLPGNHHGDVAALAAQARLPEAEARRRLVNAGILEKARFKRVPRGLVDRAMIALGIKKVSTATLSPATAAPSARDRRKAERAERRLRRRAWKIIGPEQPMVHVTPENVTAVHWALVADFKNSKDPIDPPGVRSEDLLHSAVHRSRTSLGETSKYPSVAM